MPYFVAFFLFPGVAFSNSSMTSFSFNSGAKRFLLLFKFKQTCTPTIFGGYGILAHVPYNG